MATPPPPIVVVPPAAAVVVPPPPPVPGGGTALHYTLALFYILIATFIMILAWIIPGIVMAASVTFTLIGSIIFIAGVIQVVYTAELAASLCGTCPPPLRVD